MLDYSTRFGNKTLYLKLADHWNRLPYDIRTVQSIGKFKCKLNTHLFKQAYSRLIKIINPFLCLSAWLSTVFIYLLFMFCSIYWCRIKKCVLTIQKKNTQKNHIMIVMDDDTAVLMTTDINGGIQNPFYYYY